MLQHLHDMMRDCAADGGTPPRSRLHDDAVSSQLPISAGHATAANESDIVSTSVVLSAPLASASEPRLHRAAAVQSQPSPARSASSSNTGVVRLSSTDDIGGFDTPITAVGWTSSSVNDADDEEEDGEASATESIITTPTGAPVAPRVSRRTVETRLDRSYSDSAVDGLPPACSRQHHDRELSPHQYHESHFVTTHHRYVKTIPSGERVSSDEAICGDGGNDDSMTPAVTDDVLSAGSEKCNAAGDVIVTDIMCRELNVTDCNTSTVEEQVENGSIASGVKRMV